MTRVLKDWIESYLEYTKHSEAPESFHKWTAISTIAGALRGRVWLDMGYFTWKPNFYIILIAPPGVVSKSTTAGIGERLLHELGYIKRGPSATNGAAIIKAFMDAREDQLLPDGSYRPTCALNFVVSELGTFLKVVDEGLINVLIDLWDGKEDIPFEKFTKGDGEEYIINPWINLIGCTTPTWAAQNFSGYFMGGGFASRAVFIYENNKRDFIAYPYRHLPPNFREQKELLVEDLRTISNLGGAFVLSGAAEEWGEKWYKRHWTDAHDHITERFQGYIGRKQTHLHKLAMVRAASLGDDLLILPEHLAWADTETTKAETNFAKVFQEEIINPKMRLNSDILRLIRNNGGRMNKAKLYQEFINSISQSEFSEIIASMIYAEMLVDVPPYLELPDYYKGEG